MIPWETAQVLFKLLFLFDFPIKGGKFNFTTTMDFPQTGHRVVIEQRFHGVDVFNYLRMSINVYGTLPSISHGSKIEIADYEEEHHKTGLGKNNFFVSIQQQQNKLSTC